MYRKERSNNVGNRSGPFPEDAKKVVDNVLTQLEGLSLPETEFGRELNNKIPPIVEILGKHLPDLTEVEVTKKHKSMVSELQLKAFLAELAKSIEEAMDIVKMGKALSKWALVLGVATDLMGINILFRVPNILLPKTYIAFKEAVFPSTAASWDIVW